MLSRDPELLRKIGEATALEVRATCIAVCRDPRWGRCYESYSEDHRIVQAMTEIIPGLQGDLTANSQHGVPFVGGNIHMPAYLDSIKKCVATVMISYSSWNGVKMHANRDLVTGFLKDKLKFKIGRVSTELHPRPMLTTLILFMPESLQELTWNIENWLGTLRRSLVLLKNGKPADTPLPPLPKKAPKILVTGTHADNLGYECGGWTIEWQGVSGNEFIVGTSVLTAVKNAVDPTTQVVYCENPDKNFVKSNDFSYAIVVVGETPYVETFGDGMNLTIPEPGPSIITNVCGGTLKCVVALISGRPVVI
ncbi:hypothetical protein RHGRI_037858 [Rhododendron griersonianum]|uniref:beta-glucosidase n=1 Tax=Rhododendron griersonianum TaxID=479676 RepID=A0AAV6HWW6_9ERIC|nr:hypothetical protein RHGRI_037858 [Rhododendron griersonianum]